MQPDDWRVLYIAAQGADSNDQRRLQQLARRSALTSSFVSVTRSRNPIKDLLRSVRLLRTQVDRHTLVFLEGTGVRVGAALLLLSVIDRRLSYVVSSGDAVDTYLRNRHGRLLGYIGRQYEKALYRRSVGFVGWSPYLVGRAIRMGAPSGLTIEGEVPAGLAPASDHAVLAHRRAIGVPDNNIVIGVAGSLNWSRRQKYCYGLELVNAASYVSRTDVSYVIVGGGSGQDELQRRAAQRGIDVTFTGQLSQAEYARIVQIFDMAILAQTPDELGLLRLTTKLPEYLSLGVPVAMTGTPGSFDYFRGRQSPAVIRLPLFHPASDAFARSLAAVLEQITPEGLRARRDAAILSAASFDGSTDKLSEYINFVMNWRRGGTS